MLSKKDFIKINDYLWEIPQTYRHDMRVPARAYVSEKMLEESFKDKSLNQLINVATLPGIVKYSLAMPDMHEGYGFCVSGSTKILSSFGFYFPIRNFTKEFQDQALSCFQFLKKELGSAAVQKFFRIKPKNKVYTLITKTGRKIIATEDHPFYTSEGMIRLTNLKPGDKIAILPFSGVAYQKPKKKVIISERDIQKTLKKLNISEASPRFKIILRRLKERDLLPLTYNHPKLPYLLKIIGFLFGDGSMNFIGKRGDGVIHFSGKPEDLEKAREDIEKLGYTPSPIHCYQRKTILRKKSYQCCSFAVNASSLLILLETLGVPRGSKVNQPFRLPKWIFQCPLWQKRLFLAALFGSEMRSPCPRKERLGNFVAPSFSVSKRVDLIPNGLLYLKDLQKLLKEFGVKSLYIERPAGKKRKTKSGKATQLLTLVISPSTDNLINLWEKIGFEYNKRRFFLANVALGYLYLKRHYLLEKKRTIDVSIPKLLKKGLSYQKIASRLASGNPLTERFIIDVCYKIKKGRKNIQPRIPTSLPRFEEYLREVTKGLGKSGLIWEEIVQIKEKSWKGWVYDFTLNHPDHNFIANNFLVSNCIGGVAATDIKEGVISPGGVGYDINCGMRLLVSDYTEKEIQTYLEDLATEIQKEVPSGLGKGRKVKIDFAALDKILKNGARALVEAGYGEKEDIENCEASGALGWADPTTVSERAKNRGRDQVGTLGSGNHFLEIQKVDQIFNPEVAKTFGLFEGQVVVMIHTGSRGLGHQIASDYIRIMMQAMDKYGIRLPDRELAACPINSSEGQRYFSAMACGANYAWANRQMIAHYIRKAWKKVLGENASSLKCLYDVAHNIAKLETHIVDGQKIKLCVHRKGSTRAFPPGHPEIPEKYRAVGQPVLIPGSMGTASYVLVGTKEGKEAFFSTCFTGDTKLLTNKGVFTFSEIYKRFYEDKEEFLTLSFNERTLQFEWKPITKVMKRKAPVIEIRISQTGRSRLNTLKVTPDHKFITLSGPKFIKSEIAKIIEREEMIFLADKIPGYNYQFVDPRLAYVVGAIMTDGSVYPGPGNGRYPYRGRKITFIQKKTSRKLDFINYVQSSFQDVFNTPLREYKERTGGGEIRGKLIQGTATDFVCTQTQPIQQLLIIEENLIPWVLSLSEEATFNFLAGAIDGDGTWHPDYKVIEIFNGGEKETAAIVLACLKLGILPYVSRQRGNCYIVQISEKIDEITKYTKRVKNELHLRKYGTKLFSVRQLFKETPDLKWPFLHKSKRNNLMSAEIIRRHLNTPSNVRRYSRIKNSIEKIISSPLRMQRVKKNKDLGCEEVFNITVKDNHNYIVLTNLFSPVLVANCHGAGRTMSRHAAIRTISGKKVVEDLQSRGIVVKCWSWKGVAEEAPQAYKNIDNVVEVVHKAGLSLKVAKLKPLAVIKGE